jgi:hypothetical protein
VITLKLLNLDELRRRHAYLLAENEKMAQEGAETAGVHAKDHVNKYNAFKRQTGHLQASTKTTIRRLTSGRLLRIDNTAKYADPIDTGARPHKIVARRVPYLMFWWPKLGLWFVGRSVNHPGNKPYKFMYRAWFSAGRVEEDFLRRRMALLAKRF